MKPEILQLKQKTIAGIIEREGGYSNNPADSGGETMYGITIAVARRNGYTGQMRALPISVATVIYENKYWDALSLDIVADLSLAVAAELADTGVNMGIGRAAEFLQRALNALNNGGRLYADVAVDGDLGAQTLAGLRAYLKRRGKEGETVLLRALNGLQTAYYISLAERRQKDEAFMYGWLLTRVLMGAA